MKIGVPAEIKSHEYRVGLTPASARELHLMGHQVYVQSQAGAGIGATDEEYQAAGAQIRPDAASVFAEADMIVKVKEPQASERKLLKPGQILFTYLHLAPDPQQTADLLASGAACIAYETVTAPQGGLPLLAPMSEVAGRLAVQAGAHCLERAAGGKGLLLGGVPGVASAKVIVLGAGMVGRNAAEMALGLGADVTLLDRNVEVLRALQARFDSRVKTRYSDLQALEQQVMAADLVIGSVLVPGAKTPHLVSRQMVASMQPGSVLVDVAIDQGGCFETSHPTTHESPTFIEEGVVHYCVANMPGAVPRTATAALNNVTLPFVQALAEKGLQQALIDDPYLRQGLNVYQGELTQAAVAKAQGLVARTPEQVLGLAA